ncbi:TraR/DksA family transcriptional regulator [Sinimarinibacterium flocculans]|uniref:TraR/DksA family transcriptional regulator n=1 Tax=Sinimarinibacterium flocculans TaxID=985250 RepID=UPI0035118F94
MGTLPILRLLTAKRDELASRLQRVRRDLEHADGPVPQDFADQATVRENDDVLNNIEQATALDLAQYEHAIRRTKSGQYGVCEHCGDRISAQRLAAVPQATACAGCAYSPPGLRAG